MTPVQKRLHSAALQLFSEKGVSEITVSDLAQVAGVARGTVYNNLVSIESLFADVASELSSEMIQRVVNSADPQLDPAQRIANGIRLYVRRAHEEPQWGRFLTRYALNTEALHDLWSGPPIQDMLSGLAHSRFSFDQATITSVMGLLAGATLSAILLVLDGRKTWREAGSETAELVLRAIGLPAQEAFNLARQELPVLAPAV